eukprot:4243577-Pyramimonas_sp.AAC.1
MGRESSCAIVDSIHTPALSLPFLEMALFFLVSVVLQMSYRAVQHSNGKGVFRGNSEMYLDA